jgi:hypothetical protein
MVAVTKGRPPWFVNLIKRPFPKHLWLAEFTKVPRIGHAVEFALFHGGEIELNIAGETAIQASIDRIIPLVDLSKLAYYICGNIFKPL